MRSALLVLVLVLVLAPRGARADDPWADGVSAQKQHEADQLFAEGNQLFAQQAHGPALDKYKAAIALWDHPLIRFNMAVTEIRLDHILDAAEDLSRALRFGAAPFTPELYRQALDYQALVKKQVGDVRASCAQSGVHVVLDGKPWFDCPSERAQRVLAGEHVIVGERAGFMTQSRRLVVIGGGAASARMQLQPVESAIVLSYPVPRWIPWTATGGGAALAIGGLGVWLWGKSSMDKFQADFARVCPAGCPSSLSDQPQLARERSNARLEGAIGASMMVVGGAAAIAGVVGAILDRPRRILPKLEVGPEPGGATVAARWRW